MNTIIVRVQVFILSLFPELASGSMPRRSSSQAQLAGLANGLALPSFWTAGEITAAFTEANRIWDQAKIVLTPTDITHKSVCVPPGEDDMWIAFTNQLSPRSGTAAAFVYDLTPGEGGWGGGRIAIISGDTTEGALPGFAGRVLAHEFGHVLTSELDQFTDPSNLMFGRRQKRVISTDLLTATQIATARTRANAL